ncbi:hypothetical protein ARMGADRAFT_1038676 [Armillaria gallica]|uniref:Uncharacterized protein n=1 Tax=Armillaria gallica TaxID=47427 RepID=A0A2H3CT44_ARMGA|nr:hypothetical protein ARMGADRAFT_1038676 [Armillaria gallica]
MLPILYPLGERFGEDLDRISIAVREIDGETSFASNIVQDPERKCKTRETTCGYKPLPVPVPQSNIWLPGFRVIGANTDLPKHRARLRRECAGWVSCISGEDDQTLCGCGALPARRLRDEMGDENENISRQRTQRLQALASECNTRGFREQDSDMFILETVNMLALDYIVATRRRRQFTSQGIIQRSERLSVYYFKSIA